MSQANTQTAQAPKRAKLVLLAVTRDDVSQAARKVGTAIAKVEDAKRGLLTATADAIKAAKVTSMSAKQFDRQFRPECEAALAKLVQRGKLTEGSAKVYVSKLKTVFLSLANGLEPLASETFWEYADRASTDFLPTATLGDGSPVWEASTKRGPKAGKPKGRKGGQLPGAVADANSAADSSGSGFNRSPQVAAALILTGNNEARAQRLVLALASYGDEFDKWCASVLSDDDKAKVRAASKPQAPTAKPDVVTVAPDVPGTALADQLVKAQRKANERQARKAA